jgi:osmotically-inducible protein OsmY
MISVESGMASESTHVIAGRVAGSLHASGHSALRKVKVSATARTITLQGNVPSYYLKQLAQTVAKRVDGVATVVNDTVVLPSSTNKLTA